MDDREPPRRTVRVELTVRSAVVAIGALAAVWLFLQLWQILLVVVVALMLVGMLNPFVERLTRRHVRRSFAVAIVFGLLSLVVGGLSALTLPSLVAQAGNLFEHLPESQARLADRLQGWKFGGLFAARIRAFDLATLASKAQELGFSYGPRAVELVAYGVSASFLALYFILDRDRMRGALFAMIPRSYHVRTSRVLLNLETIVGGYMRGQVITSVLMAVFTLVVLLVVGVPNALALALFAGLADVLPYIGALLACGPSVLAALSKGVTPAIIVLVLLAAYQEFESRILVPRIYGRVLRLPAATVLLALLIGGKLLGILGAILALPIAAGIRMVLEELRVELPGEEVDDDALREKDARAEAEFEARAAGVPATEAANIATEIAEARRDEDATDPASAEVTPLTSGKRD